jgi:hypothetical protein
VRLVALSVSGRVKCIDKGMHKRVHENLLNMLGSGCQAAISESRWCEVGQNILQYICLLKVSNCSMHLHLPRAAIMSVLKW